MTKDPTPTNIHDYIVAAFDGVVPTKAWGETSFFYNPDHVLKRGTYFATIKEKDGESDKSSNLDRESVWRLNFGIPKSDFQNLFGLPPARPAKGGIIEGPWDFTQLDQLTPHPVYGWMAWIAVNNPSKETFEQCMPLLGAAYAKAKAAFDKRVGKVEG